MDRNIMFKHLSTTKYLDDVKSDYSWPEYEMSQSDIDNVLREIFSIDERSGFPRGDIAYFLSKDGNPQVKSWLETNLLAPRVKQTGTSLEDASDDLIAEYARIDGESNEQYSERLRGYYDSAHAEFEKLNSKQE